MPDKDIIIHTDGGSRGNPGQAAVGYSIDFKGKVNDYAECVGTKTNNEAEYLALIIALKKAKQLAGKKAAKKCKVLCFSDSELMVNQLNHKYKLKDAKIQKLFIEIWNLMIDFGEIEFAHIKREKNSRADKLLNDALDQECSKLRL